MINRVTSEWEIGLFPEGGDEKFAALGSLEPGVSECAELDEVLGLHHTASADACTHN